MSTRRPLRTQLGVALATLAATLVACAAPTPDVGRTPDEPPLALTSVGSGVVLPGSRLAFTGSNFGPASRGELRAHLASDGLDIELPLEVKDAGHAELPIDLALFDLLGGDGARFDGLVTLRAEYQSGAKPQAVDLPLAFALARSLVPRLGTLSADVVYLGSGALLQGDGFLTEGEGGTFALLRGTFTPDAGAVRTIDSAVRVRFDSRTSAAIEIGPDLVGIHPGVFAGTLALENRPLSAPTTSAGAPRALTFVLGPTALEEVSGEARRGQRLVARGRGFVPKEGREGQATILRLDGTFTELLGGAVRSWRGGDALELVPDFVSPSELSYLLRVYETSDGSPAGLGLVAGTFEGRVTPVLLRGADVLDGVPVTTRIDIKPQRQVVFLKYLAGFTDSLRHLGLRNVELYVRRRIFEVCLRDYARWNVEFREARPTDYEEYAVVEIGGPDPNGQGLFGLDNTTGKDLGNVRFNDVIGGYNAETQEQGFLAFGGVFLESFLALSPRAAEPLPIAHPDFDRVFDPLRADRGGSAVLGGEYPGTRRDAVIEEAVRVLGNLVGTTVTHEIGHTLGMAIADGFFHNPFPGPNQIMDSGDERPFQERAELGGRGPAEFEPEHALYLDRILPREGG